MCGIFGFYLSKQSLSIESIEAILGSMSKSILHRGPDDQGQWTNGLVGLGHNRLSIIDLSALGHQPMLSPDGNIVLVFNGEIYNFLSLRKELEALGHHFKSRSDTEVIIQGYLQWGDKIFQKLRGMFAISIWDNNKKCLILARDRVGKKPLYYSNRDSNVFLFGSEIKAILCWPNFPREPDFKAIHHYLTYQYVPAPNTAFVGIKQVMPGTILKINKNREIRIETYSELPPPRKAKERPVAQLKEELLSLLEESVRLRMISDVPLGAFLSGGVDSSAVVAMMARNGGRVKTFSIGFTESSFDERQYARMVAERYGTDHHELVVTPSAVEIFSKLVWHYGQPFADASAIPSFYVSEFARPHVKVVLTGDGADESFLGYPRYEYCLQFEDKFKASSIKQGKKEALLFFLRNLRRKALRKISMDTLSTRNSSGQSVEDKPSTLYSPTIQFFSDSDKEQWYDEAMQPFRHDSALRLLDQYFEEANTMIEGAAFADLHTYLLDDILVKMDVASMAHSLEVRSPFLDQEIMQWAASIPGSQKLLNGLTKGLLKNAMEPYLPHDVLYRKKMGFGVPLEHWFKNELKEMTHDVLLSSKARSRGIIKPEFVETMLHEHCNSSRLHHTRLWALMMLELWYCQWIDNDRPLTSNLNADHKLRQEAYTL